MSRFLGRCASELNPYTPGEQPREKKYIKLNTNESPYAPSPMVSEAISELALGDLRLYPDPEGFELREAMADLHGVTPDQVFPGAGSDEVLGYAFLAFFDQGDPVCFADITYGFYKVYAQLCGLQVCQVPLRQDYTIEAEDYFRAPGHIFIANPNAPTGIALSTDEIEQILIHNPDRLVVIDEAYVDFSKNRSCVSLAQRYDNLLVVQTFSKSRSLAGMRIGCAIGHPELIQALSRIKYSFNPYNLDRTATAAGIASIEDSSWFLQTTLKTCATRDAAAQRLVETGFRVLPSETNFLFASYPGMQGDALYHALRNEGILVRHFPGPRTGNFIRVTIGTDADMQEFHEALGRIVK